MPCSVQMVVIGKLKEVKLKKESKKVKKDRKKRWKEEFMSWFLNNG